MELYLREELLIKADRVTQPIPGRPHGAGGGAPTAPAAPAGRTTQRLPAAGGGAPTATKTAPMTAVPSDGGGGEPSSPESQARNMQPCSVGGRAGRCEELGGPPGGADTHEVGSQFEVEHSRRLAAQGAGAPKEETTAPAEKMSPEEAKQAAASAAPHMSSLVRDRTTQGVTSINPEDYPEDTHPMDHYKVATALEARGEGTDGAKELAEGHRNIARQRSEGMSPEEHEELAQQLHAEGMSSEASHHDQVVGEHRAKEREAAQAEFKEAVDPEFDELLDQFDDREKARDIAKQALEDYKAKIDPETGEWSAEKYEEHKEQKKAHEAKMHEHAKARPRKPPPFTEVPPDPEDYPEDGKKYKEAQTAHGKRKKASQDDHSKHKKDDYEWKQKDQDLKDEYSEYKARDKDFKEAEGQRKERVKKEAAEKKEAEKRAKEEEKVAAKEAAEKPRSPQSDMEHAQVAGHRADAHKLHENLQAWLDHLEGPTSDFTEEEKEQLRSKINTVRNGLQAHMNLQHVPAKEHTSELKELQRIAGEHGKKPPEEPQLEEGEEAAQEKKKRKPINYAAIFRKWLQRGKAVGAAAGDPTGRSAGRIGADLISYGAEGVVSSAEHLIAKPRRRAKEEAARGKKGRGTEEMMSKDPGDRPLTLGEQAEKERTSKGLYLSVDANLDLLKAVQVIPNTATTTPSDKTAQRQLKTSYAKHPTGVMGGAGIVMEDDPDVGARWKHAPEDSVEEELEEEREMEAAANKDVKKSMLVDEVPSGLSMLSSLNKSLDAELSTLRYNPREVEFMTDVMGASRDDIRKGLVRIIGRDRHRFHEWLIDRMRASIDMTGVSIG